MIDQQQQNKKFFNDVSKPSCPPRQPSNRVHICLPEIFALTTTHPKKHLNIPSSLHQKCIIIINNHRTIKKQAQTYYNTDTHSSIKIYTYNNSMINTSLEDLSSSTTNPPHQQEGITSSSYYITTNDADPPLPTHHTRSYRRGFFKRLFAGERHACFAMGVFFAAILAIIAFFVGYVFIPTKPSYTICNQNIKWTSIFNSIITQGYPSVNVTIHAALYNPNRFVIELYSVKMLLFYKQQYFGYARLAQKQPGKEGYDYLTGVAPYGSSDGSGDHYHNNDNIDYNYNHSNPNSHNDPDDLTQPLSSPPLHQLQAHPHLVMKESKAPTPRPKQPIVVLEAGSATDVYLETIIEPTLAHAIGMSADYMKNELLISLQVDFDTSVFSWWTPSIGYNAAYDFNNVNVTGGGADGDGDFSNLCLCHG